MNTVNEHPHIFGKAKLENPQLEIRHFISTQNMKEEKKTVKEHSPTRKVGRAIKLYKPQTCWQKKYIGLALKNYNS